VWIQDRVHTPLALPVLVIGAALAYIGSAGGNVRLHYIAVATLVFVFAATGSLGVSSSVREILSDQLIGLGLIVIGLGDHLLLLRAMEADGHVHAI
jgi:hypothetical protein